MRRKARTMLQFITDPESRKESGSCEKEIQTPSILKRTESEKKPKW